MTVAIEAALVIQDYASLWDVADLNGDVVARGAFGDSLNRTGAGGVRMLHQHTRAGPWSGSGTRSSRTSAVCSSGDGSPTGQPRHAMPGR